MDTITHGIVGALVGKALFAGRDVPANIGSGKARRALSSPTARVAIVGCTLGAIFPDIDIFAGPVAHNALAIMEWHRNITHSLVLLPLWAVILTIISMPAARRLSWTSPPFPALYGIYVAGLASHVFLDLVTNFGTMVWSPLRYSRAAWDWVFILDLTLTALALAPQLAAWCYRDPWKFVRRAILVWLALTAGAYGTYRFAASQGYGFPIAVTAIAGAIFAAMLFLPTVKGIGFRWTRANWCRAGLALVCAYIALAATAHHKAFADVQRFAAAQHLQVEQLAAMPLPPTLTHWAGLVSTPDGVWRATFHEPSGNVETTQFYIGAPSRDLIEKAKQLPDVQVYLWFARFPVWRVVPLKESGTAIEISDVRFFREAAPSADEDPPVTKGFPVIRPRPAGFTFQIVFDAQKRVVSDGFKEPE
jgi:membrane-bound metal-dependent hydrolase YbcI (DUF457 family)